MKQQLVKKYTSKEKEFYNIYFEIFNMTSKKRLTAREREFLSILCSKPLSFILLKRSARKKADNKSLLAKELGVTVNQVSNLIRPLIERRMLIENEEEELLLNPNINILRKTIKENLKNGDFEFDYTLNFKITKDE